MFENEIRLTENQDWTPKLSSFTQALVQIFEEMTTSLGDKNIDNERSGKYYMIMVALLLILFDDAVLMLLLFAAAVCKLSSLTQGLEKYF